jgi:hypothetical protein
MVNKIKNLSLMRNCILFWAYMKDKMQKYGMKIFQPCVAESGNVCNSETYYGAEPKDKGYSRHAVRWFSSFWLLDHVWAFNTEVIVTTVANRNKKSNLQSSKKLKDRGKTDQRHQLLVIKCRVVQDVYVQSTAHTSIMVEAPISKRKSHLQWRTTINMK